MTYEDIKEHCRDNIGRVIVPGKRIPMDINELYAIWTIQYEYRLRNIASAFEEDQSFASILDVSLRMFETCPEAVEADLN